MLKPNQIFNSFGIIIAIILLCISLLLLFTIYNSLLQQEAFGHAFVIDTEPGSGAILSEPPANINAFINEPVDLTYSQISVLGSDGEQVDTGDLTRIDGDESTLTTTLPSDLSEGTYTVSVQMLSQIDGHLTQDTFVFGVGEQGEIGTITSDEGQQESIFNFDQISTGSAIARFPALVGQVMVVGAAFCLLWLWRPITRIKWLNERFLDTQTRIQYRTILLMITGAIILIISDFLMIFSLAISIGAPLVDTINTTFGEVWLARTILSFVILVLAVIPLISIKNKKVSITKHPFTEDNRSGSGGSGSNRSKYVITSIIFVLGLVTLLTTSLMGHAAAVSGGSLLPISLDYIHNVVASLWIGGVIYLAFVVAPILKKSLSIKPNKDKDKTLRITTRKDSSISSKPYKSNNNGEKDYYAKKKENLDDNTPDLLTINSVLSIIIPRFSFVPVIILGTILLTGPFLLYILEDDLTLTLFSLYGIILLTKLVLAAVMISIGIYYQMVIHKQSLNRLITYSTQIPSGMQQTQLSDKVNHNNDDNKTKPIKEINDNSNITLKKIVSKFNSGLKAEAIVGILLLASVALLTNTGLPESETGIQGRQLSQDNNQIDENVDSHGYTATRFLINEMYDDDDDSSDVFNNSGISEKVNEGNNQQQQQIGQLSSTTNNNSNSFIKARLAIEPFQPGNNRFTVSFTDANNNPVNFIDDVNIKMTKIGESIGSVSVSIAPIGVDTEEISTGVFTTNASFGFSGQWEIEVEGVTSLENASNLYTVFNPFIKPSLEQMTFNITEFNSTSPIQPLYPVYDDSRNVIWIGDTILNSGRILEFDIDTDDDNNANNFLQHNISGASVITQLALDTNNSIWYIDPLIKVLGHYDPQTQSNKNYDLFDSTQPVPMGTVFSQSQAPPNQNQQQQQQQTQPPLSLSNATEAQGAPSALDIDSENNIWITVANTNIVLKFDTSNKTFTKIGLPTVDANPLGVTVDENDVVWIAEGGPNGKIAKIDSNGDNYSVKEYSPKQSTPLSKEEADPTNSTVLNDPIFILPDPQGLELYISEHEGQAISVFNPITETFRQISLENNGALPFGMAFDVYNNLWIAEHLTNKITVIDPVTEEQEDVTIPGLNPFNQYLTTDSKGQVWAPEQRGNALARVDINVNSMPISSGTGVDGTDITSNDGDISYKISNFIETTGGFERLVAPIIAVGIIIIALMYVRTVYTLSKSMEHVKMMEGKETDKQ